MQTLQNPFHGEFNFDGSVSDASGLSEANSRFKLYATASKTQITTILSTDIIVITEMLIMPEANITVQVYDGSNNTVDAGETIAHGTPPANGGWNWVTLGSPHYCQPGTWPKIKGSAAGVIRGTIRGHIISQ